MEPVNVAFSALPNNNGDDSNTGGSDTSGGDTSTYTETMNANPKNNTSASGEQASGLERNLSKETKLNPDQKIEYDPIAHARQEAIKMGKQIGLSDSEISHLQNSLTGFAMAGIELNAGLINQQAQNVSPVKFELDQIRQQMAGRAGAEHSNLSMIDLGNFSVAVGGGKSQQRAETPSLPF